MYRLRVEGKIYVDIEKKRTSKKGKLKDMCTLKKLTTNKKENGCRYLANKQKRK